MIYLTIADMTENVFIRLAFITFYLSAMYGIYLLVNYQDRRSWQKFQKFLESYNEMEGIK